MDKYDPVELILSIIYHGQGQYTPEEVQEIIELMYLYSGEQESAKDEKKKGFKVVSINTFDNEDYE